MRQTISDPMTDQPRHHCMIVHAYYPLAETRVQREAEALLKRGFQVDVICLQKPGQPAVDSFKGVSIYRLPVRRDKSRGLAAQFLEYLAFFVLAMFKVTQLHFQHAYTTIQAHNPPDFLIFAAWLPRLLGARLVLDLHDLLPEFYVGRFQRDANSWPVRLVCLQERLSCAFAHRVITVSHQWREALAERGVPLAKISVVMNVADDTIFRPPAQRVKGPHADGRLDLIYHGNITYRYGLDLVLRAMHQLGERAPGIHLTILGGGDYMDALEELADALDLNDRVSFYCAFRPAEELPAIILQADAGIVPYRDDPFTDGLVPTKLLEYAALELPAIASRTTAILNYFKDTMVEFFTPGDLDDLVRCLVQIYDHRSRLAELSRKATKFNQRFSWAKVGAEYVALVEDLAKR